MSVVNFPDPLLALQDSFAEPSKHKSHGHDHGANANGQHCQQRLREQAAKLATERKALPIFTAREKLIEAVREHDNLVIVGETGSGKTTQIPQYLYEAGFTKKGMIAVTQPRRVAAITVAQRVAQEMGVKLGSTVGYSIRFDDTTSNATRLKYATDGMLIREAQLDPLLSKYSVVILDEAHERTLHTDILFALLKDIQQRRKQASQASSNSQSKSPLRPLKVIAMSATLQAEQFSNYFFGAKALYISGRTHPVDIFFASEPQPDYLDAAVITVLQLHLEQPLPGDILVFLTGQEEIETARKLLEEKMKLLANQNDKPRLMICPIYAALQAEQQLKAFEAAPPNTRKVILATNIAETSVTISGVVYVIDTGVVKIRQYHSKTGMDCLVVVPISKAEAWQRSGRAGRERPGQCYRLFTEDDFLKLRESIVPEILRCSLSSVVLQLKSLGVDDILGFDFMDKPPRTALIRALEQLYALGALDDSGKLTTHGSNMVHFPVEPTFAKALLASALPEFACSEQMLSLVSMLTAASESLFIVPKEPKEREKAGHAKRRFISPYGDHLTMLEVYRGFSEAKDKSTWCFDNYISKRTMQKVCQIRKQLVDIFTALNLPLLSCAPEIDPIRRCLVSGFFLNAARLQPDGSYKTMSEGQIVYIHPSSVLAGKKVECVLYNELVLTARQYMREVTQVELTWLPEIVPRFFSNNQTQAKQKLRLPSSAHAKLSGGAALSGPSSSSNESASTNATPSSASSQNYSQKRKPEPSTPGSSKPSSNGSTPHKKHRA